MPSYIAHLTISFIVTSILFFLLFYFNKISLSTIIFTPYILLLSVIPDIDHHKSKARKILNIISLLTILFLFILFYVYLELFYLIVISIIFLLLFIIYNLKHRSFTHNPIFGLVMSLFLFLISPYLFVLGFVSFLTHLLLDYY